MQAKFLRILQERRFERIGGSTSIDVDVRIIAASNRSLARLVRKGSFRQDLYYRLNVVTMELPPLRERKEDIPLLATHFAQLYSPAGEPVKRFAPEAMELLLNCDWPGNVRQLANAIERACVTSRDGVIQLDNLPPELSTAPPDRSGISIDLNRSLPEVVNDVVASLEKQYITRALRKARGNMGRCARICGLSRRSITTKISQYGIDRSAWKTSTQTDEEPPGKDGDGES